MTYKQALKKIILFMERTGINDVCRTMGCNCPRNNYPNNIAAQLYLCDNLISLTFRGYASRFNKLRTHIYTTLELFCYGDHINNNHPKELMDNVVFNKHYICFLNEVELYVSKNISILKKFITKEKIVNIPESAANLTLRQMRRLSYKEALNLIENFMVKSGLRDFCSNVCAGACCSGCYETSPSACIINEGRRLTCSAFICSTLIEDLFDREDRDRYRAADDYIVATFANMCVGDIYFNIHGPKIRNTINFDSRALEIFKDRNLINKCKLKLKELRNTDYWSAKKNRWKPKFIPAKNRGSSRKTYLRLRASRSRR